VAFVVNQRGLGVPAKKWGFKKLKDFRIRVQGLLPRFRV
jgi:hypothetical protein